MKTLLLQPTYDGFALGAPVSLGYIASSLKNSGHEVALFDGSLHQAQEQDFLKIIAEKNPDLVGIPVMSRGHNKVKRLIRQIRENFADLPVVIGGPQVCAFPELALEDLGADYAVFGEGEKTACELADGLKNQNADFSGIKGLVYKDSAGRVIKNAERDFFSNLDEIPFPAWDLMPPRDYSGNMESLTVPLKGKIAAPLLTSRGCPYNCTFCASGFIWKRRIRFRSAQNVLSEIVYLKEKFMVDEIHIIDDNFTFDIERAKEICELLIKNKLKVHWKCPNGIRIDRVDRELMRLMKESGCYYVGVGVETAEVGLLRRIGKRIDLKSCSRVLEGFRETGILTSGFFIFGLMGETAKTMEKTLEFALRNKFDRAQFSIFTPYPGTKDFDDWLNGQDFKFQDIDWDKYDGTRFFPAKGEALDGLQVESFQRRAYLRFYLRPRVMFNMIFPLRPRKLKAFFSNLQIRKWLKLK